MNKITWLQDPAERQQIEKWAISDGDVVTNFKVCAGGQGPVELSSGTEAKAGIIFLIVLSSWLSTGWYPFLTLSSTLLELLTCPVFLRTCPAQLTCPHM